MVILAVIGIGAGVYWKANASMEDRARTSLPDAGYDWSLRAMDGQVIPFSNFKGKTVFLNFWATWRLSLTKTK